MSTSYKIRLKRFNGTDYDTLNLVSQNIIMSSGNDLQTDFTNLDNSIDDIVYVGGTTPTDPDTKIWLDTDSGGASAVNSVNGHNGVVVLDALDVGATEWDLLWENASPTSSFSPQTIQLDLSGYNQVLVCAYFATNWANICNTILCDVGDKGYLESTAMAGTRLGRVFLPKSSEVEFKECNSSGNPNPDNNSIIPHKIYGIKGVITS